MLRYRQAQDLIQQGWRSACGIVCPVQVNSLRSLGAVCGVVRQGIGHLANAHSIEQHADCCLTAIPPCDSTNMYFLATKACPHSVLVSLSSSEASEAETWAVTPCWQQRSAVSCMHPQSQSSMLIAALTRGCLLCRGHLHSDVLASRSSFKPVDLTDKRG